MNRVLAGTVMAGVMVVPCMSGRSVMAGSTHTPMQGSFGDPFSNSQIHGIGWNAANGGGVGTLIGDLYDNILTINGGAATAGWCQPFCDIPHTQAFVDWANPVALWGDDLHGISGDGPGSVVVTKLRYGYWNGVATGTHIIKIYDMVPPSHELFVKTPIAKGALLASIVAPDNPIGQFMVTITGLNHVLPHSAVWIKFAETGPGFPGTFWLSGGIGNGVGYTHPGVTYTVKDYYPDGSSYNLWFPFQYFYFATTGYVASNIQVALSGFHVPAPAAISLLGVAGLMTMRRRRRT